VRSLILVGLGSLGLLTGCIPSNVVAVQDRAVITTDLTGLDWQEVIAEDVPGLYESVAIEGEAAGRLWKIYYLFESDGRYAAAALLAGAEGLEFQTLNGVWELTGDGFVLDGGDPVQMSRAPDHLRMVAPNGVVVLRASEMQ
jgi:hypothetical protein